MARRDIFCVKCGLPLECFPDEHNCIKEYNSLLSIYERQSEDYNRQMGSLQQLHRDLDKQLSEVELIDSKINHADTTI